ncbi:MAG: hypothetical protein JWL71_1853 [Acidobacteria bacterium]|nr:hypothetical protein [Acidobacteriota bacterium]
MGVTFKEDGRSTPPLARSGSRDGSWALVIILAIYGASWALVAPRANVPVIDDWVYAWSVEHLLQTRQLRVLEISAFYPITQILWGALFARALGFSFVVLRASTVVLSALGCWSLYLTLRELGCRVRTGLIGAVALAFHPLYFALSFSFMTEVPFIACSTMALYWYVRAIRRDSVWALWAGCGCAIAAYLIRPIGIVLPLAVLAAASRRSGAPPAVRRAVVPVAAATLVLIGGLQIVLPRVLAPLDWAAIRVSYLRWWFMVPITSYVRWTVEVAVIAAFPVAPLLLAYATRWRRAASTVIGALAIASVSWLLGYAVRPLPNWQTWSLQDIAARAMIAGALVPSPWSVRMMPIVMILGLLAVGALAAIAARHVVRRSGWRGGDAILLALAALHIACIHALWLYNDRYYLVLAPLVIIAAARAVDSDDRAQRYAAALLVVWAAVGITGTRDMLAFNGTAARAAEDLERTGVPPWDVDAGYALNGWRLYAHPEHLPPGANRRYDVPFVTSDRQPPYVISNSLLPGSDLLRILTVPQSSWQATSQIYVVRRHVLQLVR